LLKEVGQIKKIPSPQVIGYCQEIVTRFQNQDTIYTLKIIFKD